MTTITRSGRRYVDFSELERAHERIRELEAELATEHDHCDRFTKERNEWKARAEKAEAESSRKTGLIRDMTNAMENLNAELRLERDTGSHEELCPYKARAEKAEARVAKLEAKNYDEYLSSLCPTLFESI